MDEDLIDATHEAFEHLAFSYKAKSRLKSSLDLEKVMSGQPVTFELDTDNVAAELSLEDDEEADLLGLDTAAAATTTFFSKRTQAALSKNSATFEALASTTDFICTDFADLSKSMISIHPTDLVKKELIHQGTSGRKIPEDGKAFLHYIALTEGADEPCDSTLLRRVPFVVDMRKADVLPGFFLAIQSMELGEVAKFIVKSSLAFGPTGCPPRYPPNADILYIIEVLQILDATMLQNPLYMTADERALLPFPEILSTAEGLRTEGNGHFNNGSFWTAVKKYRKGAAILEDYPLAGAEDEETRNKLLHTLYANLAQCYLNLERPAQACTMAKLGLRSAKGPKEEVKLLFRFAKAKFMLKDYEACQGLCDTALKTEPANGHLKDLRQQAIVEEKKRSAQANKMFQGILQKK